MKYNEQIEKDIQEIMDEFDWDKVHKTMLYLDWQWFGKGVPSVKMLQESARGSLEAALDAVLTSGKKKYKLRTGTGGFEVEVSKYKNDDKIYMELKFVLASWENY